MRKVALAQGNQAMNWLIWGGSLVTVFFWTPLNDPFNAPKSWILSIVGFWLLGWVLFQIKTEIKSQPLKWATISAGFYLLTLTASFIATDNKYVGMFGDYQRRTGYLSYFCLLVFFLSSSYLFRLKNVEILQKTLVLLGFITGVYGFLQHFKHDFVHWNNPYNSVLSTLGNPDFAAAVMGIFLIASFGAALQSKQETWFRICAGLNVILLFVVILFSQVRQGLFTAILGISIIFIIWIYQRKKYISYALAGISSLTGLLAVAGMLNMGPLIKYFYKTSVTYRGDYWRAGWRMFMHHPLFGVGLDRYGAYFRQYRDTAQSLRRGPDLVANAAHDIPIQLAATGGIFVLLAFVIFTTFVLWRGVFTIKRTHGSQQLLAATIFATWVAYEAQSLISIDNLGIAIWGYVLGGAVVGISVLPQDSQSVTKKRSILQPVVSIFTVLLMMIVSLQFFGAETAMKNLNQTAAPQNQSNLTEFKQVVEKPSSYIFKEPTMINVAAGRLAQVGDIQGALVKAKQMVKNDPRFYEAQELLARIFEFEKNWNSAISTRMNITKIDPYNQINLLHLGEDYKSAGNLELAHSVLTQINTIAPNTVEAKQALKDFGN